MPRPLHPLLATMLALTACAEAKQETTAPTQDASTAISPAADIKAGDPGDGGRPSTAPPDAASVILDGQATDTAPAQDAPFDTQMADDAGVDLPPAPPTVTQLKVVITAPSSDTVVEVGESVGFIGVATDSFYGPEDLQLVWSTSSGDVIQEGAPGTAGWTQGEVQFDTPGNKGLILTATTPNGQSASTSVNIGVCTWGEPETFSEDLTDLGWTVYGDAFWEPQGWLEMTGNVGGKKGAIFNTDAFVNPGDVTISFSIWTGEGINTGADGFAMSVVNASTVEELETFIDTAQAGGCLGYGVSGPCGAMPLDAFHIEFDTWHNGGDPNTDPTPGNHVGITLNGNPGDHLLWAAMPEVENSGLWHQVEIDIDGSTVIVNMDGTNKLTGTIPDFLFHGGFIGFSGTTGWASNYHRFDNLHVTQGCKVPSPPATDL